MLIYRKVSALAVRHVFDPQALGTMAEVVVRDGAKALGLIAEEAAGKIAGDLVKKVAEKVRSHFTDHSEKVAEALARSNERAWKTIEVALGGTRFRDRFASADDHALREKIKSFLESVALPAGNRDFLETCLAELRAAREKGHLSAGGPFDPTSLAEDADTFVQFGDPEAILAAECDVVAEIARELRRLGYPNLGRLMAETPTHRQSLLAMSAQYYFRRAIADDAALFQELTWVKLITIDQRLEDGFAFVTLLLAGQGEKIDVLLSELAATKVVADKTFDEVLAMHETMRKGLDQLRPRDGVSYADEGERGFLEEVKRRYRTLSEEERRQHPELGLRLGLYESAIGENREALAQNRNVAELVDDPAWKARAYYEAYRAALNLKSWEEALTQLQNAVAAAPSFARWPRNKFTVERILGAGAFAVAFQSWNNYKNRRVVLKSIDAGGMDRNATTVFHEAQTLDHLGHPGIIKLFDCGYGDEDAQRHPYLEIEYFADSLTLEDYIHRHGQLVANELLPLAVQVAAALKAAHDAGVWHRDIKPSNLLILKTEAGWNVKVIDFGLSLRRNPDPTSQSRSISQGRFLVGSPAGYTLEYAAPEQLDPKRSQEVGPHSDVYAYGRSLYCALFGVPQPDDFDRDDFRKEHPLWGDLLRASTARHIDRRLGNFSEVLDQLHAIEKDYTCTSVSFNQDPVSSNSGSAHIESIVPAEPSEGHHKSISEIESLICNHLTNLAEIASHVNMQSISERSITLKSFVEKNTSQVAVIGGFRTGKTTLLNSLLCDLTHSVAELDGKAILPWSEHPIRVIPTMISYATQPRLTAMMREGGAKEWSLSDYKAEIDNEGGILRDIDHLELYLPSKILQPGITFTEVPIDSDRPFTRRNQYLLERSDAILLVLRHDILLIQEEREFIQHLVSQGMTDLMFVVNLFHGGIAEDANEHYRTDRYRAWVWNRIVTTCMQGPEYSGQDFAERRIYFMDALAALEGRLAGDTLRVTESGVGGIEQELMDIVDCRRRAKMQRQLADCINLSENLRSQINALKASVSIDLNTHIDQRKAVGGSSVDPPTHLIETKNLLIRYEADVTPCSKDFRNMLAFLEGRPT